MCSLICIRHLHARLFIAAFAPAEAISCRPLTFLEVTRGKPLPPEAAMPGPMLVRLLILPVEVLGPLTFETRRMEAEVEVEAAPAPAAFDTALLGLVVEFPRGVIAMFFMAVTGGSGRGLLLLVDGAVTVFCRLMGDSLRTGLRIGGMEDF